MRQLLLFGIAGTLGFFVDAGVVSVLVHGLDWNPYAARAVSFLCAVATTYVFNRHITFAASQKRKGQAGLERTFDVQVQFRLGKRAREANNVQH